MVALTADANTKRRIGDVYTDPVKAATKIFAGAIVCLDAAGNAQQGATAVGLKAVGRARAVIDNLTGIAGAQTVDSEPGVYRYANSAAADLIARTEIGTDCYVVDDQTVAKTDGGATRSIAGKVVDVEATGVWVRFTR